MGPLYLWKPREEIGEVKSPSISALRRVGFGVEEFSGALRKRITESHSVKGSRPLIFRSRMTKEPPISVPAHAP